MEHEHEHEVRSIMPNRATGSATNDAFGARKHDTITKRTNKGRTTQRVTKRGRAQVVGSWTHDADGAFAWSGAVPAVIGTHVGTYGTHTLDILKITNTMFGDDIEPMIGTDLVSYEQVGRSGFYGRPLNDDDARYWNHGRVDERLSCDGTTRVERTRRRSHVARDATTDGRRMADTSIIRCSCQSRRRRTHVNTGRSVRDSVGT